MPDKGEELALSRLIQFADSIAKIYPPGIIIWIVSDGHVFSDCIGVDDSKVNRYFQGLQNLYQNLKPKILTLYVLFFARNFQVFWKLWF